MHPVFPEHASPAGARRGAGGSAGRGSLLPAGGTEGSGPSLLNPNKVEAERRATCSSVLGCLLPLSHPGQLRACRDRGGMAAAPAGGAGPRRQMFWDSSACSRFSRERSTWSPFRSNLRLISNFWLHYLAGLFIFCLSEFSSLPVVVPSS